MARPPGFDTSRVSPTDAVVTVRSLPRRFRKAFDQADGIDAVARRPDGAGLSPLEHAAWTATALGELGATFRHVQQAVNPRIELPPVDPSGPVIDPDETPASVLSRLDDTARSVADAMAGVHGEEWLRTGQSAIGVVSALDIARLLVRIGIEHLRAAERAGRGRRGGRG